MTNEQTIDLDIKINNFSFSSESVSKGKIIKLKPGRNKIRFNSSFNTNILSSNIVEGNERIIEFHFKKVINPNYCIIEFDGECILTSPQQSAVNFLLSNEDLAVPLNKFIMRFILKYSCIHAEELARDAGLKFFPPSDAILKRFKLE